MEEDHGKHYSRSHHGQHRGAVRSARYSSSSYSHETVRGGEKAPRRRLKDGFEIKERGNSWAYSFSLKGLSQEEVHIASSGDQLRVYGSGRIGKESVRYDYTCTLPKGVDVQKAQRKYHEGVLEIIIQKARKRKNE